MEVSVQEYVILTEKTQYFNIDTSRRIPREDHHELLLLNGCISCLERLAVSFMESQHSRLEEGGKAIHVLVYPLSTGSLFSSIGPECHSPYMARQGMTRIRFHRFLKMVVRDCD